MPCRVCAKLYTIEPCKCFMTAKELEEIKNTLYGRLYSNCSCKECLIKTICRNGPDCPPYREILYGYKKPTPNKLLVCTYHSDE